MNEQMDTGFLTLELQVHYYTGMDPYPKPSFGIQETAKPVQHKKGGRAANKDRPPNAQPISWIIRKNASGD